MLAKPQGQVDLTAPLQSTVDKYEAFPTVEPVEKQTKPFWAYRWLRIGELIHEYSKDAKLIYVTLPFPRSFTKAHNYMGWLDLMSDEMPPTIFVRGNGKDALTYFLE